jgi:uncharacterized protein YjbI with pentapeptide repeats
VAIVGVWFTTAQTKTQQKIEVQRAQEAALQAYLDQMGNLLLTRNLRESEEDSEVRTLARARTLTVLRGLGPSQKADVMQFLLEAELIQRVEGGEPIIKLDRADLSDVEMWNNAHLSNVDLSNVGLGHAWLLEADLREADLSNAYLKKTYLGQADLSGADLSNTRLYSTELYDADLSGADLSKSVVVDADLSGADLSEADLSRAVLNGGDLSKAHLSGADLSHAYLGTDNAGNDIDLSKAHLSGADLSNSSVFAADLSNADLSEADLSNAELYSVDLSAATGLTHGQITEAKSLEGSTMPNGQKYEDWLKSKGSGEDE